MRPPGVPTCDAWEVPAGAASTPGRADPGRGEGLRWGGGRGQVHGAHRGPALPRSLCALPTPGVASDRPAHGHPGASEMLPRIQPCLRGTSPRHCHPDTCHNTRSSEAEVMAPRLSDPARVGKQRLLPPALFCFRKSTFFPLKIGDLCSSLF